MPNQFFQGDVCGPSSSWPSISMHCAVYARGMIEIVDRSAQMILGCRAVGRAPSPLPDEIVRSLRQMGDLLA